MHIYHMGESRIINLQKIIFRVDEAFKKNKFDRNLSKCPPSGVDFVDFRDVT
jgi:hypothetical protein